MTPYVQGFMAKCAEYGIDHRALLKYASTFLKTIGQTSAIAMKYGRRAFIRASRAAIAAGKTVEEARAIGMAARDAALNRLSNAQAGRDAFLRVARGMNAAGKPVEAVRAAANSAREAALSAKGFVPSSWSWNPGQVIDKSLIPAFKSVGKSVAPAADTAAKTVAGTAAKTVAGAGSPASGPMSRWSRYLQLMGGGDEAITGNYRRFMSKGPGMRAYAKKLRSRTPELDAELSKVLAARLGTAGAVSTAGAFGAGMATAADKNPYRSAYYDPVWGGGYGGGWNG